MIIVRFLVLLVGLAMRNVPFFKLSSISDHLAVQMPKSRKALYRNFPIKNHIGYSTTWWNRLDPLVKETCIVGGFHCFDRVEDITGRVR